MLLFKNIHGKIIDPLSHTLNVLKNSPYSQIHIGSDSQNVGKKTINGKKIELKIVKNGL